LVSDVTLALVDGFAVADFVMQIRGSR
jgi:hypothetical protein